MDIYCGPRDEAPYIPTPEEIEAGRKRIQGTWSEREWRNRVADGLSAAERESREVEVPVYPRSLFFPPSA